jgi:hypothetical protein
VPKWGYYGDKYAVKYLLNRKLFELIDKKVRNYSLFDKFLNPYLNPSLVSTETEKLFFEKKCPKCVFQILKGLFFSFHD